jgi:KinB signaling pathway activation protein
MNEAEGEEKMKLKNLILWFFLTIAISGIISIPLGFLLEFLMGDKLFIAPTQMLLSGLTFGSVALLGFFSYLIFNWLALGILRNATLFQWVQIALILVVMVQVYIVQFQSFQRESIWIRLAIPFVILIVSICIAGWKAKKTNPSAFIPTLFFMIVVTVLEALPSLHSKAGNLPFAYVLFTVLILLICNAFQIGNLHRWVSSPKYTDKKKANQQKRLAVQK